MGAAWPVRSGVSVPFIGSSKHISWSLIYFTEVTGGATHSVGKTPLNDREIDKGNISALRACGEIVMSSEVSRLTSTDN